MRDQETRCKFIEMRAQGVNREIISMELGVSVRTVSNWSKKFSDEIAELRGRKLEEIHKKELMLKEHRIRAFAEHLDRIWNELNDRDLSSVTTTTLFRLFLSYCASLRSEIKEMRLQESASDSSVQSTMEHWEEIMRQVAEMGDE